MTLNGIIGEIEMAGATHRLRSISLWLATCLLWAGAISCAHRPELDFETIGHYDTSGWAHDVTLDAESLYVSDRQGGYLVFNRDGTWTKPRIYAPAKDVISLAPHDGRPLLAARFEGLVLANRFGRSEDRLAIGEIANAVVTRGDLAYAAYGGHGLVICRFGVGGLALVSQLPTSGWSHDIKLWHNRVLLADWNYGLRVVDISVPQSPVEVGVLPSSATTICISIGELNGQPVAAVAEGHGGVSLVAFDAAGNPFLLSRHALGLRPGDAPHPEAGGWAHGVALFHKTLFVANWKRGLAVLNVQDPRAPRLIMELPTAGTSLGVKAEPGSANTIIVYLADGEDGLRVFRFRPPQ
jgi:hypothetical protein